MYKWAASGSRNPSKSISVGKANKPNKSCTWSEGGKAIGPKRWKIISEESLGQPLLLVSIHRPPAVQRHAGWSQQGTKEEEVWIRAKAENCTGLSLDEFPTAQSWEYGWLRIFSVSARLPRQGSSFTCSPEGWLKSCWDPESRWGPALLEQWLLTPLGLLLWTIL